MALQLSELLTIIFGIPATIATLISIFPGPQLLARWYSSTISQTQPQTTHQLSPALEQGPVMTGQSSDSNSNPPTVDQSQGSLDMLSRGMSHAVGFTDSNTSTGSNTPTSEPAITTALLAAAGSSVPGLVRAGTL